MRKVLDGPIGDEILKACEKQGFIGLAFYDSGSRSLYTTKKPIKTIADVKGMKIRVQQSDLWVALLQAMGANATPMPYGEVYTALKTGVVDGAENNWPSYDTSRHFEVAKYYAITDHSMAPEMLLMSKKVWDTLTPAGADRSSATRRRQSVPYMRKLWDEKEARVAQEGRGGRRAGRRGRQEVVPGRDEAGVRQVHHRSEDEGHGAEGPGDEVTRVAGVPGPRAAPGSPRPPPALPPGVPMLLSRICAPLAKYLLMIAVVGLMAIVACVAFQVFGRYVMNDTPTWAEASRWCSILYVTMFGAAVGVRDAGHIGMESLLVLVPERMRAEARARHPRAGRHLRRADGLQRRAARDVGDGLQDSRRSASPRACNHVPRGARRRADPAVLDRAHRRASLHGTEVEPAWH